MAWKDELLGASFRAVPFPMLGVNDKGEKALVVHEYPWRAGAEVEDMGRKARRIPVRAVFWGDDYLSALSALVTALEEPGKGELIHPVFGAVDVTIQNWDITHEAERPDYATLNFEAVESALDVPFFQVVSSRTQAQAAQSALQGGLASVLRETAAKLTSALEESRKLPELAKQALTEQLGGLLDVYDAAHEIARSAVSWFDYAQAFISDLKAVQQTVFDATDGTGFARISRLSSLLPRLSLSNGAAQTHYPAGAEAYSQPWVRGSVVGRAEPVLAIPGEAPVINVSAPVPCSVQTALGVAVTHAMMQQTALLADTAISLLLAQMDAPVLTPQEVESVAGNTRQRMQDCMDYARASLPPSAVYTLSEAMRTAADGLQALAAVALHARPPLIKYTMPDESNFHLLAHQLYGDYARAAELAHLNTQIRNPNFIAAGQELLIYAR